MLARDVVRFSEQRYDIDWTIMRDRLAAAMAFLPWKEAELGDPLRHPTYWCLPALLGDYVHAPRHAVLLDTQSYAEACLIRHHAFDHAREFEASAVAAAHRLFAAAYASNLLADGDKTLEQRLAAKCSPWLLAICLGTRRLVSARAGDAHLDDVLNAIRTTFAAVQVIDDWNDRAEDRDRSLWNLWNDEENETAASHLSPLLDMAGRFVGRLAPHPLTRVLAAQVADTRVELGGIVTATSSAKGAERRG